MPIQGVSGTILKRRQVRVAQLGRKKRRRHGKPVVANSPPGAPRIDKSIVRDYTLYVLELERGNYYVGITARKNVSIRFQEHADGKGAQWTKAHRPVRIIETRPLGKRTQGSAARVEDDVTIEYVDNYGINRVRGGSLCQVSTKNVGLALDRLRTYRASLEDRVIVNDRAIAHQLRWIWDEQ